MITNTCSFKRHELLEIKDFSCIVICKQTIFLGCTYPQTLQFRSACCQLTERQVKISKTTSHFSRGKSMLNLLKPIHVHSYSKNEYYHSSPVLIINVNV